MKHKSPKLSCGKNSGKKTSKRISKNNPNKVDEKEVKPNGIKRSYR